MSYTMFRDTPFGLDSGKKQSKRKKYDSIQQKTFVRCLINPGADLLICDEGHEMKNPKSMMYKSVGEISTTHRILLTGTPVQNNLDEYYWMMSLVRPDLLGNRNRFHAHFLDSITTGQQPNATMSQVLTMKRRSYVLSKLLDCCVQRKDHTIVAAEIPPKKEYVAYFRLTSSQRALYKVHNYIVLISISRRVLDNFFNFHHFSYI